VKGEVLEGENAYFCEMCQAKRKATKRLCIKSLPTNLVIQLKRFHFDWEANRALKFDNYFQFPWLLDMSPYTMEGVQAKEEDGGETTAPPRNYDLVGVVVHSGQASAGHYYSFIKDRRRAVSNKATAGKWFKFNDTTVEEFDMTQESLESECFGGTFKVKKDEGNSNMMPENRHRYWNGYILFYEAVETDGAPLNAVALPTPPRKAVSHSFSPHQLITSHSHHKLRERRPSPGLSRLSEPAAARESLSQLSDLLEKGEKRGLFSSRMPGTIERRMQEENLRFLENRDVYCEQYYSFVCEVVACNRNAAKRGDYSSLCVESVRLAVHFLFNTYYHVRQRQSAVMADLLSVISHSLESSKAATDWLVDFLATPRGLSYISPFLVECPSREVRTNFGTIIATACKLFDTHGGDTEGPQVSEIISAIVTLINKEIPNNVKTSGQFFATVAKFAHMVRKMLSW
jgi:ubiquitin carboxyl-terminal hydrolase 9/24